MGRGRASLGVMAILLVAAWPADSALSPASPQFSLRDTAGALHTERAWLRARAIVLFFVTIDCPLSNGYVPEMNRLAREYSRRDVLFYAVASDASVPEREVRRYAQEFGFRFPVLLDERSVLVRHAGATVTPEVAVLSPAGTLLYLGRIDNRVEDLGTRRHRPTQFDLLVAVDAVLAGRRVLHARTTAIGCFIPAMDETGRNR